MLLGLNQPQMPRRRGKPRIPHDSADHRNIQLGQRIVQQCGVARAADTVQNDARNMHLRVLRGKAGHDRCHRLGHPPRINHQHHRQVKLARQICHGPFAIGRCAVKEAHRALDNQQLWARSQLCNAGRRHCPGVKVHARPPAGGLVETRVDIVRARFCAAHSQLFVAQRAQETECDRGFAAARSRRGYDKSSHAMSRVTRFLPDVRGPADQGCARARRPPWPASPAPHASARTGPRK